MADLPSRLDLTNIGRDFVRQRARRIDPIQVDVQGSNANLYVGSGSILAFHVIKQLAYSVNRLLLDGAEGEDLDRYAYDRYQLPRKGASPALTTVQVTRPTFLAGAGTVPVNTLIASLTNVQYVTISPASFGATDLKSQADVRAVQAGKATQVGANQLVRFLNPGALWDQTLKVGNEEAAAGGEDREDDDTFRNRIRDFWNTARRGVLAAIEFGAKTVPGVVTAQAIEVVTGGNTPARVVLLYVSDSTGVASRALAKKVEQALLDFRAAGIAVIVSTSVPEIVDVVLHLTFKANVDTVSLAANVQGAVVELINSLPVNGPLGVGQIYSVLTRFVDAGLASPVPKDAIIAPAGDIVPDPGRTLRTTLANVAFQ